MKLLLVMDMQEITVGNNHADIFAYHQNLLQRVNERIAEFPPDNVIYIRNLMKRNWLNRLAPVQVYDETPEAELATGLKVVSEHIFDKYEGNAFSNHELLQYINALSPEEIEVIGVDGGGCVANTAIGAAAKGYKVSVNEKCVGTVMIKREQKLRKKMLRMGIVFNHNKKRNERPA